MDIDDVLDAEQGANAILKAEIDRLKAENDKHNEYCGATSCANCAIQNLKLKAENEKYQRREDSHMKQIEKLLQVAKAAKMLSKHMEIVYPPFSPLSYPVSTGSVLNNKLQVALTAADIEEGE